MCGFSLISFSNVEKKDEDCTGSLVCTYVCAHVYVLPAPMAVKEDGEKEREKDEAQ